MQELRRQKHSAWHFLKAETGNRHTAPPKTEAGAHIAHDGAYGDRVDAPKAEDPGAMIYGTSYEPRLVGTFTENGGTPA